MASLLEDPSSVSKEDLAGIEKLAKKYSAAIKNPPTEAFDSVPFVGKTIAKYYRGQFLEGAFFFLKSGDPVIDQKMFNAVTIKDYERKFGLLSGLFWGGLFASLPALKGFSPATRAMFFTVPFTLAYYRSFRRGYDQIEYVGKVYLELLIKKRVLLEYLGNNDGQLTEIKEAIMKRREYKDWLRIYGVKPYDDS